jgi:hypothetical protein
MSEDRIIEIRPDGAGAVLVLRGKWAGAEDLPRPELLAIASDKLARLRSGEAPQALASEIANSVSDWFLSTDLEIHLRYALGDSSPFRVVLQPVEERLAASLVDVPFELLEMAPSDPLALKPAVRAIVHQLQKIGRPRPSPSARDWPLRVLVVRSNPNDLGGEVPPAAPIRQSILDIANAEYGPGSVDVRTISNEPGVGVPATWDGFRAEIALVPYDILVFLGHGDVAPGFEELPGTGLLKFEELDGQTPRPITAAQLNVVLQQHPVPVVILAGCLTAAAPPGDPRDPRPRMTRWMRGNQGVAQALVNSESGVQIAVGMRYRLESLDATLFLGAYFRSLLTGPNPGDVEAAVHAGREALYANQQYPPSWSAPVIYGAPVDEPLFDYLQRAPSLRDPADDPDQLYRDVSWSSLAQIPFANRTRGVTDPQYAELDRREKGFLDRYVAQNVPVVWPSRFETVPGLTANVDIRLHGALAVQSIEGRVTFTDRTAVAANPKRSAAVAAAGFKIAFVTGDPGELGFIASRAPGPGGPAPGPLPAGPLFSFEIPAGVAPGLVNVVDVVIDAVKNPHRAVRGWSNAVIVSPP